MIKELAWYIESGRYSGIAEELDKTIKTYAQERSRETYENARTLFESHAVSCGLREKKNAFINIDAEFFDGKTLQESNVNTFIKDVIKNYCYQKVLWEYMGTTGSFTQISKIEMEANGQEYEKYLPISYKETEQQKKRVSVSRSAAEGVEAGEPAVPLYLYSDGSVSETYDKGKAKLRFNALQDTSGFSWNRGYDANDEIRKEDWYGAFNEEESWVKVNKKEKKRENGSETEQARAVIELYKTEDGVILYDPGMILLDPAELVYLTETGAEYGREASDTARTVEKIEEALKVMGEKTISAVSTGRIAAQQSSTHEHTGRGKTARNAEKEQLREVCARYRSVLGNLAGETLEVKSTEELHEAVMKTQNRQREQKREQKAAVLEKTIRTIIGTGVSGREAEESLVTGRVCVPVSVLDKSDAVRMGLDEKEYEAAVKYAEKLDRNDRTVYEKSLTNLVSSWNTYETAGLTKEEMAQEVYESIRNGTYAALGKSETVTSADTPGTPCESRAVSIEMTFKEIAAGTSVLPVGCSVLAGDELLTGNLASAGSGYSDTGEVSGAEFSAEHESGAETYLKQLEEKRIIPENSRSIIQETLRTIQEAQKNESAEVQKNVKRGLYRVLNVYSDIAASTGMTVREILESAACLAGGKSGEKKAFMPPVSGYVVPAAGTAGTIQASAGNKRIFFERSIAELIRAGVNRRLPVKETEVEQLVNSADICDTEAVLIAGGVSGKSALEVIYGSESEITGITPEMTVLLGMLKLSQDETASAGTQNTAAAQDVNGAAATDLSEKPIYIEGKQSEMQTASASQTGSESLSLTAERRQRIEQIKTRLKKIAEQVSRKTSGSGNAAASFYEAAEKDSVLAPYIRFNLTSKEGLDSYLTSPRFRQSGLTEEFIRSLSAEINEVNTTAEKKQITVVYKTESAPVQIEKKEGRGKLEKIRSEAVVLPQTPGGGKPERKNGQETADIFDTAKQVTYGTSGSFGNLSVEGQTDADIFSAERQSDSTGTHTVHAPSADGEIPDAVLVFGGISGQTVSALSGLNARRLEKEYGYSKSESRKVMQYLESVRVPEGQEKTVRTQILPEIKSILSGSKDTAEVREKIAAIAGRYERRGAGFYQEKREQGKNPESAGLGKQAYEETMKRQGAYTAVSGETMKTNDTEPHTAALTAGNKGNAGTVYARDGSIQIGGRIPSDTVSSGREISGERTAESTSAESTRAYSTGYTGEEAVQPINGTEHNRVNTGNERTADISEDQSIRIDSTAVPYTGERTRTTAGMHGLTPLSHSMRAGADSFIPMQQGRTAESPGEMLTGRTETLQGQGSSPYAAARKHTSSGTVKTPEAPVTFSKGRTGSAVTGQNPYGTLPASAAESGSSGASTSASATVVAGAGADICESGTQTAGFAAQNWVSKGQRSAPYGKSSASFPAKADTPASVVTKTSGLPGTVGQVKSAADSENEKLKRIIANYENDRKKEKVTALARSATHDIGHAEGSGEDQDGTDIKKNTAFMEQLISEKLQKLSGL